MVDVVHQAFGVRFAGFGTTDKTLLHLLVLKDKKKWNDTHISNGFAE